MAGAATAAYSTDAWTSPNVDGSQWEYAVPVRRSSRRSKSRSSYDSTRRSRDRTSKGSRSSSQTRPFAQEHVRGRRDASRTRRGSEAGSSRGFYGQESASRSFGNVRDSDAQSKKGDMKDGIVLMNDDNAKWIHRDKLAKIESEELHQAAIKFQRLAQIEPSRSIRGRSSHDAHNSGYSVTEESEPWPDLQEQHREGSLDGEDERRNWDLRRPEEIAADEEYAASIYRNPGLRKSSSRIPISTASPVPISPEHAGREFSSHRTGTLTNSEDDASDKPRRASEPTAGDGGDASTPPGSTSRPVSRGAQNATSRKNQAKGNSATRKTSAPPGTRKTSTPRSRATSGARPTTRSGESRPTTAANRPEGDPPWLATMYKPDPRLPPDQQMLPTHARKIQQEQWAKEGKTPTTYDREFAPLAIGPEGPVNLDGKEKGEKDGEKESEKQEESKQPVNEKPLPEPEPESQPFQMELAPLPPSKSPEPSRPNTSTGYSTMPRLQDPPQSGLTPRWSPPVVSSDNADPPKKDKGCGCCIVM